jgi:hypothetical protein
MQMLADMVQITAEDMLNKQELTTDRMRGGRLDMEAKSSNHKNLI